MEAKRLLSLKEQELLEIVEQRIDQAVGLYQGRKGDRGLVYWTAGLEVVEKIRGTNHPQTVKLYLGLAGTLQANKKYHLAKEKYSQALQICQSLGDTKYGRYSNYSFQAQIGLGSTYLNLEKYDAAIKTFQGAARAELYMSIRQEEEEPPSTSNESSTCDIIPNPVARLTDRLSFKNLKMTLKQIEKDPKEKDTDILKLCKNPKTLVEQVQSSVRHEVVGDLFYERGLFEAAQYEYGLALEMTSGLYASDHISADGVWLARKQSLAEVGNDLPHLKALVGSSVPHDSLFPLNSLMEGDFECDDVDTLEVHGYHRVCDTMRQADTYLKTGFAQHARLLHAQRLYKEAKILTGIYNMVHEQLADSRTDATENMLHVLGALKRQLVPGGIAMSKISNKVAAQQVWGDLEYLTILVEAHASHHLHDPSFVVDSSAYTSAFYGLALMVLFLIAPLVLFSHKRTQIGSKLVQRTRNWRQGSIDKIQHVAGSDNGSSMQRMATEVVTTRHGKMKMRKILDIFEADMEYINPFQDSTDLVKNKVSALIWVQKTREVVMASLNEECREGPNDCIDIKRHIQKFLDRVVELGFEVNLDRATRQHDDSATYFLTENRGATGSAHDHRSNPTANY